MTTKIVATVLSSGYWHIRGEGPCNWAQVPIWPCGEDLLRANIHPEASEEFIRAAIDAALAKEQP